LRLEEDDRKLAVKLLYERFLRRCWRDAKVSETEAELLAWLAGNVGLSKPALAALHRKVAVEVSGATLAKAFEDGQIDESERRHLEHVAAAAGGSVGFLMSRFFDEEGEQFKRSLFTDIAAGVRLTREDWKRFRQTTEWLGLPEVRVLAAIRDPAKHLVEHTLADARGDGEITEKEERVIESLLETIIDDERFRAYVRGEIAEAKEEQDLARGLLPSVSAPEGIALRAGGIVHWAGSVFYARERVLRNGTRWEASTGTLVITDTRAIMNSSDRPAEVSHRTILA
jgi:hypothetical protein